MSDHIRYAKELVVLVADLDAEHTLRGILARWQALGIRRLAEGKQFDIRCHVQRDAGCRERAARFLEGFVCTHRHALVVFDHHGSGREKQPASVIETAVEKQLAAAGWDRRGAAVVIQPELEAWVWSDSPQVADQLGWRRRLSLLRPWLEEQRLVEPGAAKPPDPKRAMQEAMRRANKPPTPDVFLRLAETVSLRRCEDRAFRKLKRVLQEWFAGPEPTCR